MGAGWRCFAASTAGSWICFIRAVPCQGCWNQLVTFVKAGAQLWKRAPLTETHLCAASAETVRFLRSEFWNKQQREAKIGSGYLCVPLGGGLASAGRQRNTV